MLHAGPRREEVELAGEEMQTAVTRRGSRPEAVEATEATIARLEAQRRFLSEQIRLTTIVSPTAGVVGAATPPRSKDAASAPAP